MRLRGKIRLVIGSMFSMAAMFALLPFMWVVSGRFLASLEPYQQALFRVVRFDELVTGLLTISQ